MCVGRVGIEIRGFALKNRIKWSDWLMGLICGEE